MSEPNNPPPAVNPGEQDNATIRALRAEIDAQKEAARTATAEAERLKVAATERERAEMAEVDRLKAELSDAAAAKAEAQALRDEQGRYQSAFEGLYQAELAACPDDKREGLSKLSASGSWPDRLEALRTARGLLTGAPATAGTTTQPPAAAPPGAPEPPPPVDPNRKPSWGDVFKRPTAPGPV